MRILSHSQMLSYGSNLVPIEAQSIGTTLKRSKLHGNDSVLYNSELVDSAVHHSVVANSRLLRTLLRSGIVAQNATIADSTIELNSLVVDSTLVGVYGRGVTISNAVVIDVELDFGTHISDGVWMRKPLRFTHSDIPYDVTEGVEDQLLIGCWARSVAQWLQTSPAAYERIGINRSQYEIYRDAIIELGAAKTQQPSPLSLKKRKQR